MMNLKKDNETSEEATKLTKGKVNQLMVNNLENLFVFDIPELWDGTDCSEILYSLHEIAMCAYLLSKNKLENINKVKDKYIEAFNSLIDVVGGYNHCVILNNLSENKIGIEVDEDKTSLVGTVNPEYKIYKVIYIFDECDESL